jgi:RNA polymerase sigma-70 factor, ECF subfamily
MSAAFSIDANLFAEAPHEMLGNWLRSAFGTLVEDVLPRSLARLLDRLREVQPARLSDAEFNRELCALLPHLRARARHLTRRGDNAEDLVQETMLKAWAARDHFTPQSNMRAWTSTILRNHFLSEIRRNKFKGDWDDFKADVELAMPESQSSSIDLLDLRRGLATLTDEQREAVMLVGAGGNAYADAAEALGCPVGTIKSRVARARTALTAFFDGPTEAGIA